MTTPAILLLAVVLGLLFARAEIARLKDTLRWLGTVTGGAAERLRCALREEMPSSIADKLGLERTPDGLKVRA